MLVEESYNNSSSVVVLVLCFFVIDAIYKLISHFTHGSFVNLLVASFSVPSLLEVFPQHFSLPLKGHFVRAILPSAQILTIGKGHEKRLGVKAGGM